MFSKLSDGGSEFLRNLNKDTRNEIPAFLENSHFKSSGLKGTGISKKAVIKILRNYKFGLS